MGEGNLLLIVSTELEIDLGFNWNVIKVFNDKINEKLLNLWPFRKDQAILRRSGIWF